MPYQWLKQFTAVTELTHDSSDYNIYKQKTYACACVRVHGGYPCIFTHRCFNIVYVNVRSQVHNFNPLSNIWGDDNG